TDPAEKEALRNKIQKISLAVQQKFSVDEMCLIANNGKELTRIVFNEIAPDSDLSPDESGAPFYAPSFKKKHRQIHIEAPYLSADSERWVVAYTTPIVLKDGNKPAFLHYEIPLSFYIGEMSKGVQGEDEYVVVVGNDGLVYSDSRREYKLDGDPGANPPASDFFPAFDDGSSPEVKGILASMKDGKSGSDSFTQGGNSYAIVYKSLGYFDWSLAVISRN
ncbi:MAG: cache domain-containing protein, partial [Thermodesulfobacteriota bacterium]